MDDTTNDDVRSGKHMFHNLAIEKLKQYIDTELVEKEGAEFLSSLHIVHEPVGLVGTILGE